MNIISLLQSLGVKALAGLAGWQAWLLNIFLKYVWKYLVIGFKKLLVIFRVRKEVKEELKEYKEDINKEGVTADEIKQAGKGFLEN